MNNLSIELRKLFIMKNNNLLSLIAWLMFLTLNSIYAQTSPENITTPIERITEKERFEIKNLTVGMTVYQTDNLSGLYSYTKEGWISVPTTNKQLQAVLACSQVTTVETVSDLNTIHEVCGTDITTAIVLGYHTKDDGGGGIFVYDPSLDDPNVNGEGDGGLLFDGWKRSVIDRSINVKWFGARGNGFSSANGSTITETSIINENTIAFQNAVNVMGTELIPSINNLSTPEPEDGSPVEVSHGIFIPSGEYRLGEQALFREDFNIGGVKGISYFSDGNAVLTFTNTGSTYGMFNNNHGLFFTFRNITFRGVDSTTNFLFSDSQGVAQDYYFDRCTFRGQFNRIFTVRGGNNGNTNSEWGFNKCTFTSHNSLILDIKDSDQFLNYWFDQAKFWMTGNARVLKTDNGGHFKFVNCDWSGFSPNEETFLFELNGNGGAGISDFRITNGRFELKTEHAKVLKSNWTNGNIDINADFGSQTFQPFFANNPNGIEHFDFRIRENSGLNISFKNSVMMGTHTYRYSQSSFRGTARAKYENCSFARRESLDGFINISDNLSNKSGISLISIEDAILQSIDNSNVQVTDVNYLPLYSNRGLKKKFFKIGNPARGGNPIGDQQVILNFPEDAESVITKIKWFLPRGRLTSANHSTFRLRDLSNNTISSVSGRLKDGYDKTEEVFINVKDLPEGKLVLSAINATQTAAEFICLIEYY